MMDGRVANVLLVDDQPENLVALSAVLEPLGQNLVHAGSGEEALKLLLKEEFAVILLDVQMPELDGFQTAALIKGREKTRHIPIIFVTAISKDAEHVFRGYSEGAVDYVLKPYDPEVLRAKVAVFVQLHEKGAALEESEQRFRTAFANAPSGMALLSPEGRWLQVNRALGEMLGRSPAELIGQRWEDVLHPDERDGDRKAMRQLIARERTLYRAERRCLHADGRTVLVAVSVSPMGGRRARPKQLIAQLEDVTERRQAERERAERLRQQAARAEAEAVADMVRSLQSVSDTALTHLAFDDLLPELLDRVAEVLDADTASILLIEPEGEDLVLRCTRGLAGSDPGLRIPVGRGTFAGRVVKERRPIVIPDLRGKDGTSVADPALRKSGVRSLIGVPLVAEGDVVGVVRVGSLEPGRFDDDDAALLALVADRAALAIGNARLYEREHRVVETLQRSLLPASLPRLPGMTIAARYLPGGSDVGGDWYDAIALRDGAVGLAMGDVVGHGIAAASLMGQIRNALRAYALEERSPAAVIEKIGRLVQELEGGHMATLLYAVIEPDWTSLRLASAGHPPPLLHRPGGSDYLWGGRSTPLGVRGSRGYEEVSADMDGGSTLVLYTDGLVEVPGESIDAGLARLKDAVVAGPEEPEALCDHVIDSLIGGGAARDDVAFLALRTLPLSSAPLRLELPTNPQGLVNLRRTLGRWLAGNGATRREASDISLACHEACANAIEHGYGFRKGSFRVEASLEGEEIALRVRDDGAWRPPGETDRGQGLGLMRTLMDSVEVEAGASGTTVELRRRLGARTKRARSGAASV